MRVPRRALVWAPLIARHGQARYPAIAPRSRGASARRRFACSSSASRRSATSGTVGLDAAHNAARARLARNESVQSRASAGARRATRRSSRAAVSHRDLPQSVSGFRAAFGHPQKSASTKAELLRDVWGFRSMGSTQHYIYAERKEATARNHEARRHHPPVPATTARRSTAAPTSSARHRAVGDANGARSWPARGRSAARARPWTAPTLTQRWSASAPGRRTACRRVARPLLPRPGRRGARRL